MTVTNTYVDDTRPIRFSTVKNPKGFWDLVVNKNNKGKAIRISTRTGSDAVNIAIENVDSLITALQTIKARGANTSTKDLPYNKAA